MAPTIRLTKEFAFEAAHALEGYDGKCSRIHGHSYRLFVTVKGVPCDDPQSPKRGMVMDFGVLKALVQEQIVSRLDHALILPASMQVGGVDHIVHVPYPLSAYVREHARGFRRQAPRQVASRHRTPQPALA